MTKRICKNCAAYHPMFADFGECRRHAPKPFVPNTDAKEWQWPEVYEDKGCWEFADKDEPTYKIKWISNVTGLTGLGDSRYTLQEAKTIMEYCSNTQYGITYETVEAE